MFIVSNYIHGDRQRVTGGESHRVEEQEVHTLKGRKAVAVSTQWEHGEFDRCWP